MDGNRNSDDTINIHVNTSDVEIDLRGYSVICTPDDPATAVTFGIYASARNNVTIRNGKVTGCFIGVHVGSDTHNLILKGVDFSKNTYIGLSAGGRGTKISDSIFADIGGYATEAHAIGINNPGPDCLIERNIFRNIHRQKLAPSGQTGEGAAVIFGAHNSRCVARYNWLENDSPGERGEFGFWVGEAREVIITENSVTNFAQGIAAVSVTAHNNRFLMRARKDGSLAIGTGDGNVRGNVIVGYDTAFGKDIPLNDNIILP